MGHPQKKVQLQLFYDHTTTLLIIEYVYNLANLKINLVALWITNIVMRNLFFIENFSAENSGSKYGLEF